MVDLERRWMCGLLLVALTITSGALASETMAGELCDEPVADWQPRASLRAMLEASGWTVHSVKVADGCYLADATDNDGAEVHLLFDPKTLVRVDASHEDLNG